MTGMLMKSRGEDVGADVMKSDDEDDEYGNLELINDDADLDDDLGDLLDDKDFNYELGHLLDE